MIILNTEIVSIFVITIFILIIFFKSSILFKPKILFLSISIFSIAILFYFQPLILNKIESILYSTGLVHPGYSPDGKILGEYDEGKFIFSKYHHLQIITSINLFLESPLFGVGPKNFKNVVLTGWHPHNYSFQVLAEIGIFGFIIFVSTLFFLIFKFFKSFFNFKNKETKNELNIYLITGFLLNLFPIPSGDFFNNWVNILIYFPVGYYLYLNEK